MSGELSECSNYKNIFISFQNMTILVEFRFPIRYSTTFLLNKIPRSKLKCIGCVMLWVLGSISNSAFRLVNWPISIDQWECKIWYTTQSAEINATDALHFYLLLFRRIIYCLSTRKWYLDIGIRKLNYNSTIFKLHIR